MDSKLVVLTGTSAAGKQTLKQRIKPLLGLVESVSHTTRAPRAGEEDGREYHFTTRPVFEQMEESGEFVETTEYCGNLYGTSQAALAGAAAEGHAILEIEVEGAKNVKRLFPEAMAVFVFAPTPEELERRLRAETRQVRTNIEERLAKAREEIQEIDLFDYVIENAHIDSAERSLLKLGRMILAGQMPNLVEFKNSTRINQLKSAYAPVR